MAKVGLALPARSVYTFGEREDEMTLRIAIGSDEATELTRTQIKRIRQLEEKYAGREGSVWIK